MLDRLSIRSKIAVILIVPVIACAVLGSLRVGSRISTSRQADRVSKLTEFSLSGTHLAHELQQERGLSGRYLAELKSAAPASAMLKQRPATDLALGAFRGRTSDLDISSLAASTKGKLASALGRLSSLPGLRRDIDERTIAPSGALDFYDAIIADVLKINRELAGTITDPELAQSVGAFVNLSRIRELSALERELISGVLAQGRFGPGQYRSFTSILATRGVLLSEFRGGATPAQREQYIETVVGPEVQRASELENDVVASEGAGRLAIDPDQWFRSVTADLLLMHKVEQGFGNAAVARSKAIESSANSRAIGDSLIVLLAVALAVGLSLLVARSMLRPLRLLEATAKDVATNRLPGVVAKLQRSPTMQSMHLAEELEPVEVTSRDEIGEVAAAFNAVHLVAVQVAAEQAALRTSIGEMFLNLARRSQSLIDRQIELIDDLEEEADSHTLGNLFQLDHLATRMRRNAENLIVLSGAEPPRRWAEPIPLPEIVRGSVAEVEDYQRVTLLPMEEVGVPGHAVSDVIHLLAELIENATSFSPPGTAVRIGGQRAANGYVIEIEDRGLGMSDDELLQANQRLANPPAIDFAVSRMLGLFVVGRLAQRYKIRVQLRHSSYGGVTALVLLPASLLIQLEPEPAALPVEPSQLAVPAPSRPVEAQQGPPPRLHPAPPISIRPAPSVPPVPPAPPQRRQPDPRPEPLPQRQPQPQPDPEPVRVREPQPAPPSRPYSAPPHQAPPRPQPAAQHQAPPPPQFAPPQHPAPPPPQPAAQHQAPPPPQFAPPQHPAPPPQHPVAPVPEQPAPARAERLPIFEQARSEWFDSDIAAEHGPPQHHGAYPPLAARFPSAAQRGPSAPPAWASAPSQPQRPSRTVDEPVAAPPPRRERLMDDAETVEIAPLPRQERRFDDGEPAEVTPPPPQQPTAAGLPRRIPRANLAPGILEQREQAVAGRPADHGQRLRSPEEVRSLLATYRAGLERGRSSAASGEAGWPPEGTAGQPDYVEGDEVR